MHIQKTALCCMIIFTFMFYGGHARAIDSSRASAGNVMSDFIFLLNQLECASGDAFFKHHCSSMTAVIEAKSHLTATDSSLLSEAYTVFSDNSIEWNAAGNPIDYLTYYFRTTYVVNYSFEDGYMLLPWGRGNLWYQGIAETDVLAMIRIKYIWII